ncbi:MAG TPA: acyl-CoA dehydrogenase family protein [Spirochaetota bacterium]|nr:acyl-CoA dehydrogenase family protein [Spirochaetota bacterium]HPC40472.1 acyl-CoA dehydrogenase family protein [Spirochaetota bacterium]HPL15789.1 acyl-CoA dehydrogenase family protein [Spirochaetota bacterium]HQF06539.1 acyl-CoA dehydrogenase family protein [Spirochaetota bacterium]HQH96058.1 acyl-CoA dehydrogenase family protein [Spirochaetota bacterium]
MDFSLSKSQLMAQKSIRKFASETLEEWANYLDRESKPLPPEIVRVMGRLNIWGIQAPVEFGGADLDTVSYCLVIEEISRVSAAVGLGVTVHNSVCLAPILKFGTRDQIARYAPDLATGRKIGGFTVTEPQAGSDAASIQTTAVPDGDHYILNGQKAFVTNGGVGDLFIVAASMDRKKKTRGIALFLVEKSMKGFEVGKIEDMMGMRGNMVSELFFNNVRVPKENVLGRVEDGFRISMQTLDIGRIGIAAQALGIGTAAYTAAATYAMERKQFDRPIGTFQAISFMLADMKTNLDAARLLIYRAADLKDRGLPFSTESAMCKVYASSTAMQVCMQALQIFGGYGYVKDLPVERFFRDAKITEIYEGTSEVMKIIIGNDIIREFSRF